MDAFKLWKGNDMQVESDRAKAKEIVSKIFELNAHASVLCWIAGAIEEALDIKGDQCCCSPSEEKGRTAAILFLTEHGIEVK